MVCIGVYHAGKGAVAIRLELKGELHPSWYPCCDDFSVATRPQRMVWFITL